VAQGRAKAIDLQAPNVSGDPSLTTWSSLLLKTTVTITALVQTSQSCKQDASVLKGARPCKGDRIEKSTKLGKNLRESVSWLCQGSG